MEPNNEQANKQEEKSPPAEKKVSFLKVMMSVFAAMFGVRSNKYRERDFKHGKASHFIIAGLIMTFIFIMIVYSLVQYALSTAGV